MGRDNRNASGGQGVTGERHTTATVGPTELHWSQVNPATHLVVPRMAAAFGGLSADGDLLDLGGLLVSLGAPLIHGIWLWAITGEWA